MLRKNQNQTISRNSNTRKGLVNAGRAHRVVVFGTSAMLPAPYAGPEPTAEKRKPTTGDRLAEARLWVRCLGWQRELMSLDALDPQPALSSQGITARTAERTVFVAC